MLMPWMTNSGGSSSAGSGIASVVPGQSGIRNMYSLGAKSGATTTSTTTTTSTRTTSTTPIIGESFVVPLADLIKHRYTNKNKNRRCKKREAKLKEEDDNDAMRLADQACFVKDRSAVTANASPLYADSETTSHCTTSHDDFVTSVPAVKTNAFPLYVYSEDKSHARGVANSLPVTANPLEADSGAVATVSHKDSTTEGPGRHRARANRTSTTTTTTTNNDVDNGYRREDPDPAAEGGSLRRAGEGQ